MQQYFQVIFQGRELIFLGFFHPSIYMLINGDEVDTRDGVV